MEKKERKILIIGIIIATILLIVLIIFGIIYYQNIINNKKNIEEIKRRSVNESTISSDKEAQENRDESVVITNGNIKDTTIKSLSDIDYTKRWFISI